MKKRPKAKPMQCPGCDFSTAALSDCSDQLQEALNANKLLEGGQRMLKATLEKLQSDLAHSDAERRKLERDVLAQSLEMSQWKNFRCVSPALQKGQP